MTAAEPTEMVITTHQTRVLYALPPGACKTLPGLSDTLGLTHRQVCNAASALIGKGLVERIDIGRYRLTENGERAVAAGLAITSGPNAPHQGVRRPRRLCRLAGTASLTAGSPPGLLSMADTLRQRAWTAMRIQRGFTINDLLVASTHGCERNAANNLRRYLKALAGAGVVRLMRRRVAGTRHGSNGFLKYQLLKDLGEIAPTLRPKRGVLHDHNSGQELVLGVTVV